MLIATSVAVVAFVAIAATTADAVVAVVSVVVVVFCAKNCQCHDSISLLFMAVSHLLLCRWGDPS